MSKTEQDALIERIRKLRAKAEDPSVTEAEAALYAAKVAELLQQYNLSESALEVEDQKEEVLSQTFETGKGNDPWAQNLAQSVAKLYFCSIYLSKHPFKQVTNFIFVGKPHNIEVAKSMTEYLIKTIGRLAREYANSTAAKLTHRIGPSQQPVMGSNAAQHTA